MYKCNREKNGRCRLPAVLGQSDLLGRPASNLGIPERRNSDLIRSKTELRTNVSTGVSVTSNRSGVRIGGDRCRIGGAEWVRFGAWNVRLLRGREEELVKVMVKYRLEVLGVSETTLKGNGARGVGEGMCVVSGVQEGRAKAGVAVFLSKMGKSLREWKCVSERIVKIRLRIEGVWVSVIQVYAPTGDSKEEVKEGFYEQLQVTLREVHRQDKVIVMGDLNARGNVGGRIRGPS